ncbi:sugar ABC transporter ATP-binding protein [Ferviditalea candida]|uniref:Sugar ABC transporter ATP-binding protein n=1 Tax=Ferviditalea candida TaxID=3108399 RepID=A0ABU5ZDJ9_9BACL|nr:sugar ABC transporter ATP-binding protein [Paenibacillaceae bacterium T2]
MNVLEMKGISKTFPGVQALSDVNLIVESGEVHGLVGANGAGKSTLMKVLSGVIHPDAGEIIFKGQKVAFHSPLAAQQSGIAIIHQELSLVRSLSVAENIFLGRMHGKAYNIDWKEVHEHASGLLKQVGTDIRPDTNVRDLSVAQMQLVEIAKALSYQANLIIMDEPSAVLSGPELSHLFDTIASLTEKGVTVIYISHRLEEIFNICDKITIMRDGRVIETKNVADIDKDHIIRGIVGRDLKEEYPPRVSLKLGEEILSVKGLGIKGRLHDISFNVRSGEIVGLAGLVGSGRTEIARCIFGADKFDQGEMKYKGNPVHIRNPRQAIASGIALVPEDRKEQGLITSFSLRLNFTMAALNKINLRGFIQAKKERKVSEDLVDQLKIKTPSIEQIALNLSGGNQQKVVVAKYLFSDSDVLILDEPTRGVDVGAKREIYEVIRELARKGKSVILISSEWDELIALSDRLIVLHEGRIKGELAGSGSTAEKIMQLALA